MGRPPKEHLDPSLQKMLRVIGANLKQIRTQKGISQVEVAASAKISITTLNEIEKRRYRDVRLSTVCAIAQALSVPVISLLTDSDVKLKSADQTKLLKASEEIINIARKIRGND